MDSWCKTLTTLQGFQIFGGGGSRGPTLFMCLLLSHDTYPPTSLWLISLAPTSSLSRLSSPSTSTLSYIIHGVHPRGRAGGTPWHALLSSMRKLCKESNKALQTLLISIVPVLMSRLHFKDAHEKKQPNDDIFSIVQVSHNCISPCI